MIILWQMQEWAQHIWCFYVCLKCVLTQDEAHDCAKALLCENLVVIFFSLWIVVTDQIFFGSCWVYMPRQCLSMPRAKILFFRRRKKHIYLFFIWELNKSVHLFCSCSSRGGGGGTLRLVTAGLRPQARAQVEVAPLLRNDPDRRM